MCDVDPRGYLLAVRDELNAGGLPPSCCATLRYGEP